MSHDGHGHDGHGQGGGHDHDDDHDEHPPWPNYRQMATGGNFERYRKVEGKPPPPPLPAASIIDRVVDDMKDIYPPKVRQAIGWGFLATLLFSGALGAALVWTAIKLIELLFIAAVTPIL